MKDLFEIVYRVYDGQEKNQRDIANAMHISLGKVNALIKKAIDDGYLSDEDNYCVTDKGKALLEAHRVDNAIIMAAGFGSRFVPMTYVKPKGLLEVHGEVMIERQIRQLKEVGIHDITIVVGYMKEKFEYLTDKYKVKLIYNPDYSIKNNISTLYYARNEMKNSYLLTSDIYMPENIYRKYEYESFYAAEFFEEYTDEWAVKTNKDNLIIAANPSGGEQTWAMYGPTFLTKDFSETLVSLIDEIYNDKSCSQWYWEDVYIRNMDKLKLYIRKYPNNTILEFESLEELREYDQSYLENSRSDILDVIKSVFNVGLEDIVGIQTLKEGMTNDSFLFEVNKEKYVFRNPGIGTEILINRDQEASVYKIINNLKISDDIVYLQPDKGYKITKYIPNSRNIDPKNKEEVLLAMSKVKELHKANLKVDHSFDISERIEFYLNLCKESSAILFNDFDDVYKNIQRVEKVLQTIPREKRLCHIDTAYVNFLITVNEITLLDWEYAGMADPLIDIAMYVIYAGLQDEEITDLLQIYLEREQTKEELLIVHSYIALAGFLWALWTQYKQVSGEEFGTYAIEQYQYARKYSRLILKEFE